MMKKFTSHIHLPTFIVGSIVILTAGVIALLLILNPMLIRPFQAVDLVSSSRVEIYQEYEMLKFKFDIAESDQAAFSQLADRLEVSKSWQEGIGIGLDEASLDLIEGYLPLKSDISVDGNTITLSAGAFDFLPSGLGADEETFATDGATLRYEGGNNQAAVFLDQPSILLSYATESGKLSVSRKIQAELFSLAAKIDTIDLSIKGKSVEGKIVLK